MELYQMMMIIGANVGSSVGLFLWATRQARTDYLNCQKSMETFTQAWAKESKDFHGRLERMDCEFKFRLSAIEERNRK
jgi:hypothetical protein